MGNKWARERIKFLTMTLRHIPMRIVRIRSFGTTICDSKCNLLFGPEPRLRLRCLKQALTRGIYGKKHRYEQYT